ncbi:LysR family transcriptional regulator [Kibdelosporangium phytohabitans]|uniref:LysR family transcriptional regulator n=1 Tax=Kibdelosporangium phytohabitans TaxID=860235 RepID=UPI003AB0D414
MIDAIASAGSISKAAAQLDLTQPSVSTMLNRVERHLGIRLFNRSSDGVSLTPLGTEVVSRSRAILAGVDDLYATLRGSPVGEAGPPADRRAAGTRADRAEHADAHGVPAAAHRTRPDLRAAGRGQPVARLHRGGRRGAVRREPDVAREEPRERHHPRLPRGVRTGPE